MYALKKMCRKGLHYARLAEKPDMNFPEYEVKLHTPYILLLKISGTYSSLIFCD